MKQLAGEVGPQGQALSPRKASTWQWTERPAHPSMKAAMDSRPVTVPAPVREETPEESSNRPVMSR